MESVIYVSCQLIRKGEDLILVEASPSMYCYVERRGFGTWLPTFQTNTLVPFLMVALTNYFQYLTNKFDVCLSVRRCICVEKKNQLHATEWFTALIICSTCFGHFYAHHQELESICVLLPPMVCDALVAGFWRSGTEQPAMFWGWGMLLDSSWATSLIPNA